jgi:hypothetical protein
MSRCEPIDRMIALRCTRSTDPRLHPERSDCARRFDEQAFLFHVRNEARLDIKLRTCVGTVNSGNIVHAANDEVCTIRRPCQVIDLSTARPTHMFGSPRFLVFETFGSEIGYGELAGNPEDYVAVITCGCKEFSWE